MLGIETIWELHTITLMNSWYDRRETLQCMVVGLQLTFLDYQCSIMHKYELWLAIQSAVDIKCTTSIMVAIDG